MGSKVVSTKLTEEEYGKLVGLCSASGYTVSKLLKRAILERMDEETQNAQIPSTEPEIKIKPTIKEESLMQKQPLSKNTESEDRFLYY